MNAIANCVTPERPLVLVVDDDPSLRGAIERLLHATGRRVGTASSVADCLDQLSEASAPTCLLVDLCLGDGSGLDVQQALQGRAGEIPLVFMSGAADARSTARALRDGAVDFLFKPFAPAELLDAVDRAVARSEAHREARSTLHDLRERHATLTTRERQVFALVAQGRLNKQIAATLGITERTVKAHRAGVMTKMHAASVADLVRMADALAAADRVN